MPLTKVWPYRLVCAEGRFGLPHLHGKSLWTTRFDRRGQLVLVSLKLFQSYILSLAVNFHPRCGFLSSFIDYKGWGMANLFKDLPHLLGTITNLDGAQSMGPSSITRRSIVGALLGQYNNHIDQQIKRNLNWC